MRIYIISMNNYTILLEQFHIYQQQQTVTHQQFAELIDYIRNQKQYKQSLIMRKKEEKHKLTHRNTTKHLNPSQPTPKTPVAHHWEQECKLQEIANSLLRKESEQLQKQLHKIQKIVKEMQEQVQIFDRKDNDIKQLKYSSRRQLENISIQIKNQKQLNTRIQQKCYRMLEQLNLQKSNLEHQNRFLADQLTEMKSITKNYSKSGLMVENCGDAVELFKIEEIYTKRKIEEQLRCLYIIYQLKQQWESNPPTSINYSQLLQQILQKIPPSEHFHFLSKPQILQFYQQKLHIKSFLSNVMVVLQLYRSITKNINLLENRNNRYNVKLIQLKDQYRRLCQLMAALEGDSLRRTTVMVREGEREIGVVQAEVRDMCRFVFMVVDKQYQIADRINRIINTLDNVLEQKNQCKLTNTNNSSSSNFRKKLSNAHKRPSGILERQSSKNLGSDLLAPIKSFPTTSNGCIFVPKKSTFQTNKCIPVKPDGALSQYETIINRNPKQAIFKWYQVIKNNPDALIFFEILSCNDLFRIIFEPDDYNPKITELENQSECSRKVFEKIQRILDSLKENMLENIGNLLQRSHQITNKIPAPSTQTANSLNQTRYVVQSKEYYGRDNLKLMEKLQLLQLKRKGLYVPFRYGIDVEQEMLSRTLNKHSLSSLDRSKNLSCRKPRNTSPDTSNYISSYRQRVNKADRKIRDLLKNADNLRIKRKLSNTHILNTTSRYLSSSRCSRKPGQYSILIK